LHSIFVMKCSAFPDNHIFCQRRTVPDFLFTLFRSSLARSFSLLPLTIIPSLTLHDAYSPSVCVCVCVEDALKKRREAPLLSCLLIVGGILASESRRLSVWMFSLKYSIQGRESFLSRETPPSFEQKYLLIFQLVAE
jgi:hypothetical protein